MVCAMLDNQLEDLEENVLFNVSFILLSGGNSTMHGELTDRSRESCFNFTIPDDDIFGNDSTLRVLVTSSQPRVAIVNNDRVVTIEDDDGKL